MSSDRQSDGSETPRVSVITLNWNGLRHLEPCYASLRELHYPADKLELILADNGSSDGSIEFMRQRFPEVKLIQNGTNLGFAGANNIGARQASGQYVAFLNNDTRVDAEWLNELVAAVEADPDVVCAASKMLTWDGTTIDFGGGSMNFHGSGFHPTRGEPASSCAEPRELLFACGGSMLIDRQVFLDCGGFDEDFFIYYEDVDLGWRLWVLGYKVVFAPAAITYHRLHGDTSSMQNEKRVSITERNTLLAVIKNYGDQALASVLPASLLLMLERAYLLTGTDSQRYKLDPHQSPGVSADGQSAVPAGSPRQQVTGPKGPSGHGIRRLSVRRGVRKAWRVGCQQFILRFNDQLEAVPRRSLGPLVAAHDVIQLLPRMMDKRADIQRRRRRSDADILPLFAEPFHPGLENDLYIQAQNRIAELLGIQQMFSGAPEPKIAGIE